MARTLLLGSSHTGVETTPGDPLPSRRRALGTLVAVATPSLLVPGLSAGRRDALLPALLLGAGAGGLAVLLSFGAPHALSGISDPRLGPLCSYFATAMAVLALAQLLVHQRLAASPG